jgi:hypothetical protein
VSGARLPGLRPAPRLASMAGAPGIRDRARRVVDVGDADPHGPVERDCEGGRQRRCRGMEGRHAGEGMASGSASRGLGLAGARARQDRLRLARTLPRLRACPRRRGERARGRGARGLVVGSVGDPTRATGGLGGSIPGRGDEVRDQSRGGRGRGDRRGGRAVSSARRSPAPRGIGSLPILAEARATRTAWTGARRSAPAPRHRSHAGSRRSGACRLWRVGVARASAPVPAWHDFGRSVEWAQRRRVGSVANDVSR